MHLHVENVLADGVYNLVPESEAEQPEPEVVVVEADQDPSQDSEGPKASEGKHRSI
jgi:hypothetical protein